MRPWYLWGFFLRNVLSYTPISAPYSNRWIKRDIVGMNSKYNLHWYVIGEKKHFKNNQLYKIKIWNNDYVVWKNNTEYYAMDNYCSHRGASLALGKLVDQNVMCPYHGYQFNPDGKLCTVPGLNFVHSSLHDQKVYEVVEKNGWVYFNTVILEEIRIMIVILKEFDGSRDLEIATSESKIIKNKCLSLCKRLPKSN
jgi:phenylpropionate dioxygenase-like ring-hydroxylating dioxygenase large terminal subunit